MALWSLIGMFVFLALMVFIMSRGYYAWMHRSFFIAITLLAGPIIWIIFFAEIIGNQGIKKF